MQRLRYGMAGGGRDAFIGGVHRMAARLDDEMTLVAGALSSDPDKAKASGSDLGLADERNYGSWREMLDAEAARPEDDRIDFVSIVTPNVSHYEIAAASLEAGFHVVLDKPMVNTTDEAAALREMVERTGRVLAVTYNYTGYPMVKHARAVVASGAIGAVRKVIVEYNQGWLASKLEATGQKQADWRTDPARAGVGGAIGDIGSHAENLAAYVTGLEIESISADLTTFVDGRQLDDDANLLLRFNNGAKGLLTASQICVGNRNDLRVRVWGETGGLEWRQEDPNRLMLRGADGSETWRHRADETLDVGATWGTRLPQGHPEAFIEAFANVYRAAGAAMRGETCDGDFPDVHAGERGVRFIHAAVRSSRSTEKWTTV